MFQSTIQIKQDPSAHIWHKFTNTHYTHDMPISAKNTDWSSSGNLIIIIDKVCGILMVVISTHLLRTISIGTPGFTMAIFIHSLPRSTDMTATVTASTETRTAVQRPKTLRRTSNRQRLLNSERRLERRTKATAQCSVRGYQMNICIKNGKGNHVISRHFFLVNIAAQQLNHSKAH